MKTTPKERDFLSKHGNIETLFDKIDRPFSEDISKNPTLTYDHVKRIMTDQHGKHKYDDYAKTSIGIDAYHRLHLNPQQVDEVVGDERRHSHFTHPMIKNPNAALTDKLITQGIEYGDIIGSINEKMNHENGKRMIGTISKKSRHAIIDKLKFHPNADEITNQLMKTTSDPDELRGLARVASTFDHPSITTKKIIATHPNMPSDSLEPYLHDSRLITHGFAGKFKGIWNHPNITSDQIQRGINNFTDKQSYQYQSPISETAMRDMLKHPNATEDQKKAIRDHFDSYGARHEI